MSRIPKPKKNYKFLVQLIIHRYLNRQSCLYLINIAEIENNIINNNKNRTTKETKIPDDNLIRRTFLTVLLHKERKEGDKYG